MIKSDGQLWTIAGVALEGYICILFMLRHVVNARCQDLEARALDPDISRFPLALEASRCILKTVAQLLAGFPFAGAVSLTFVVLQVHVPCACLAANLLRSVTPHSYESDAVLLDRVTCGLKMISHSVAELTPLTKAMEDLNAQVQNRLCEQRSQ